MILADLPGLIEGASNGKGLGIKFLRHIERTRYLFHFVAADSEHPEYDYGTVRQELSLYNPELSEKPEFVFLSKSDLLPETKRLKKSSEFANKIKKEVVPVSILIDEDMEKVRKILNGIKSA